MRRWREIAKKRGENEEGERGERAGRLGIWTWREKERIKNKVRDGRGVGGERGKKKIGYNVVLLIELECSNFTQNAKFFSIWHIS